MNTPLLTGTCIAMLGVTVSGWCLDSLLFDSWMHSSFEPTRFDAFIDEHKAQYTDEYFRCSQEAQRLAREEAHVRDRRCDFSPDSGVRGRCRMENPFQNLDRHLADLDRPFERTGPGSRWSQVEMPTRQSEPPRSSKRPVRRRLATSPSGKKTRSCARSSHTSNARRPPSRASTSTPAFERSNCPPTLEGDLTRRSRPWRPFSHPWA